MPLPEIIEVMPWTPSPPAKVTVPGSKSITNRALVLAALAHGETTLRGALWSEDTQVMVDCLQELGFMVNVEHEPDELCNRTITVYGRGGQVPRGGTRANPLELFVGNAGTTARFLGAMLCLGEGVYRLHGVPRMHERPQAALFGALRQLGYSIESPNDRLPALIYGGGPRAGRCTVSIDESSQFASALLLCAKTGGWKIEVTGENAEESPYVAMTAKLIGAFAARQATNVLGGRASSRAAGSFRIEPDCSSGSYFWAAGCSVAHWPSSGWQIDERFPKFLPLPQRLSRRGDLGDSIMTAIVLAPAGKNEVLFTELERLRVQECERVHALRTELTKCGARVEERGNTLRVSPSALHGAEIETYNDHRMAMCFAVVGLKVPGIKIKNPACVKKTFPNFFQKLASLGAPILDASGGRASSRALPPEDLIA